MEIELKIDGWKRYMLYRASDYRYRVGASETKQKSSDAGKKFTLSAYSDVWAKDAALVGRVRKFFRENFHWYERRANTDSDLAIVELLFESIRSGAVVVAQEEPPRSGGGSSFRPARTSSLFGASMEGYGSSYLEQLRRDDAAEAFTNRMRAQMEAGAKQAAARWAAADNDASKTSTPLGDARPFDLAEQSPRGNAIDIAARGISEEQHAECDSLYDRDMELCNFKKALYGGDMRTYLLCTTEAFQNYQSCRGY
jgi:hypothetical protein